jgi:hypothetical protein
LKISERDLMLHLRNPVGVACLMAVVGAQATIPSVQLNLREMARERALRDPASWIGAPPSPPGHYEPKTIEDLTRDADVVVRARLRVRTPIWLARTRACCSRTTRSRKRSCLPAGSRPM